MRSTRVLLADGHALVRAGMRALLNGFGGIEVVAESGDGREALALTEAHQPDVVLIGLTMPGLSGLDVAARVARAWPLVRVLVLSLHTSEECTRQARRAGAAGCLGKDAATAGDLEAAVRAVARGETYFPADPPPVVAGRAHPAQGPHRPPEPLTPRQREVLRLVAEGYATKEIARRLHIRAKTVENHRTHLMQRLGIHDVAGLVRYAVRVGLVSPEH